MGWRFTAVLKTVFLRYFQKVYIIRDFGRQHLGDDVQVFLHSIFAVFAHWETFGDGFNHYSQKLGALKIDMIKLDNTG